LIRTVILGVGTSVSALVQGIEYYKKIENNKDKTDEYGLWYPLVGNYKISDIDLIGAYYIEKNKIYLELHKSIFSSSNKLKKFIDLYASSINVEPGLLSDDNMNENLQSSIEFSHESGFDPFM